jgi:mono/diheme cytochrome c family protein
LHALWILDALDAIDAAVVGKALTDESPEIRVAAIRMAERFGAQLLADPAALAGDRRAHWWVRQQLAASLGSLPVGPRETLLTTLLKEAGDDPVVIDAALSSLRGLEAAMIVRLGKEPRGTPALEAAAAMLAGTLVRAGEEESIQQVIGYAADATSAEWLREGILRGFEVSLLGAAMPGAPAGRGTAPAAAAKPLPCPTCPGGRGGPGGAYAFARPPDWPSSRPRSAPELRLARPPARLLTLAAGKDGWAPRATALLARITWPGKPGAALVAPLTADEQQLFDRGRDIYRNVCQGCHQPDGRGQDRIAPSLVSSTLTLARPDIPARVLLHGKEGPIGLMPPVGATLDDRQIAAVLTYVRREWGQSAAPITPAMVADTRRATTGRTRPWTHAELAAMVEK